LCSGVSSITEDTFLSSSGSTVFHVTDNGGGSYTVDATLLSGCGPTGTSGTLFNVGVGSASPSGPGSITITSLKLRNCSNAQLSTAAGPPGTVPVDNQGPNVAVLSPNGGEFWIAGATQTITWNATDNVAVTTVDIYYSTNSGFTWIPVASG